MSRLTNKFLLSILGIFAAAMMLSILINVSFVERYYLHEKKNEINAICDQVLSDTSDLKQTIQRIENTEKVVIVSINNSTDINQINGRMKEGFMNKGLGLDKYWLWDQDYEASISQGRKIRIYRQNRLNYSVLVEYASAGQNLIGIAMIIPDVSETISLINFFFILIFSASILVVFVLIFFLVRKITTPLEGIGGLANDISNLKFRQITIRTGDELETLADDINTMSSKLQSTHAALLEKNRQMEALLENVSHDLKTPVALIKAYASGIKDGMDDGHFLDVIIRQNDMMGKMIESLLDLSRMQQKEWTAAEVNVSECLWSELKNQMIVMEERDIILEHKIEPGIILHISQEVIQSIFSNLISNAVKYTKNNRIQIHFYRKEDKIIFQIVNGIDKDTILETSRLWEPFYVGEESRNGTLSGTGLGLSIVRAAAQRQGYRYSCYIENDEIVFEIQF
ncbi:MAG: HAMP domain-containing histidine kinase [Methanobacterium sp.]|nr:HAMP domain-containing histidine kinase [Methanobacterium sp.]